MPIFTNPFPLPRHELEVPFPPGVLTMSAVELVLSLDGEDFDTFLAKEIAAVKKVVIAFRNQIGGLEHQHKVTSFVDETGQQIIRIVFFYQPKTK